jgi:hypothetical protein
MRKYSYINTRVIPTTRMLVLWMGCAAGEDQDVPRALQLAVPAVAAQQPICTSQRSTGAQQLWNGNQTALCGSSGMCDCCTTAPSLPMYYTPLSGLLAPLLLVN